MKKYLRGAVLLGLGAVLIQSVSAEPLDHDAARRQKQIRLELLEQQKQLSGETGAVPPDVASTPAAPLELAIDETDSPGATK